MEPLSPELVLVSPPQEAAVARALLETSWPVLRYERRRPSSLALACVYLGCLLATAVPVALLVVAQR